MQDEVRHGDQDQGDEGGEEDAEGERDRHRHEERRLHALFQHEGREAEEGRQRGQQDRAEAVGARFAHGDADLVVNQPLAVDEVDHDQAVVDDDAGQRHQTEHRHHRHVEPHQQVAPDGADETERNRGHDDERLHVRPQRHREQGEDHEQGEEEAALQAADGVGLFGLGAFERVEDARMIGEHLGQDARLQVGDDGARRRDRRIDRRGHVHRAVAVDPLDRREAAPRNDLRHLPERHFSAVRGADAHVLQVAERPSIVPGIAHHDPDVVAPALDALGLLAVERLPDLPSEVLQRQAERLRRRLDAELHLLLSGPERIGDLVHAGVLRQPSLDRLGGPAQPLDVGPGELHVDVFARAHDRHVEVDVDRLRDRRRRLAPQVAELLAGVAAGLRRRELDRDLSHVCGGHGQHRPQRPAAARRHRLIADRRRDVPEIVHAGVLLQPRAQPRGPLLQLLDGLRRHVDGRALRHRDRRRHEVRLDGGEEVEVRPAAEHHPAGQDQGRDADRGRDVAPAERGLEDRRVGPADEQFQPLGEDLLEPAPGAGPAAPGNVGQMGRQDAERFDQREEQAGNHDERDDPEDLAHHSGHEHQRHERRHRRQDGEGHRLRDLPRAFDGPAQALAVVFLVAVDVLADDDGVVDDDPEHQDEREQRDDVDRHFEARHQRDRPEERDRDPEADPEGEAQFQKERQHDEHEQEPGGAVAEHERQPGAQHFRLVLPDRHRDAVGQALLRAVHVAPDGRRDVERALLAGPEHRDRDRRIPVEAGVLVRFLEAVDDRRHVAEPQAAAVGTRPQHEVLVLGAAVGLTDGAQEDLAAVGADRAAGQIE